MPGGMQQNVTLPTVELKVVVKPNDSDTSPVSRYRLNASRSALRSSAVTASKSLLYGRRWPNQRFRASEIVGAEQALQKESVFISNIRKITSDFATAYAEASYPTNVDRSRTTNCPAVDEEPRISKTDKHVTLTQYEDVGYRYDIPDSA
ncbi:hypothetical protein HDU93_001741 [Gonapodya sp. JEL0774]|nr:hypothetical protein HDU93_001741 [Gonapodya sp. JEL0774]